MEESIRQHMSNELEHVSTDTKTDDMSGVLSETMADEKSCSSTDTMTGEIHSIFPEKTPEIMFGLQPLTQNQLRTYSPLTFAYIGDAVYELYIRSRIVTKGNTRPNRLHKEAITYVNAAAQTALMEKIKPLLTQEESTIYHRGLNAKPATTAKNQTRHDYRIATGFETLIGYLYLSGQQQRINELLEYGLKPES